MADDAAAPDMGKKFEKGDAEMDISDGPVKERRCTDVICLILLILAWIAFIIVTVAGAKDGNATKLWAPRDYQGAYCGVDKNWNNGPNLKDFKKMSFMMNISSTSEVVVKQFLCSSAVSKVLTGGADPLLTTKAARDKYLCDCCLSPCRSCSGSLAVGGDLTQLSDLGKIASRMSELVNVNDASSLFSASGSNGDFVSSIWNEATKYFVQSCMTDCNQDYVALNASAEKRMYSYTPAADDPLVSVWNLLNSSTKSPAQIKTILTSSFTFQAFPKSVCPYEAAYCVPFPGVQFKELYNSGYCTFQLSAQAISAVGSAAADSFAGLGVSSFAESNTGSFGRWVGDFQKSWDSLVLTGLFAFVISLVFLVLLRFTVGACIWLAIIIVLFAFLFGGSVTFVRSFQCADTSVFDTSKQAAVAVVVAGKAAVTNAFSKTAARSEAMVSGDGSDYVGVQQRTRNGRLCQAWNTSTPWADAASYNTSSYPTANLESNFCRNPFTANDTNKASTIWCFTTDTQTRWELCSPIGVIRPECPNGYATPSENHRQAMAIISYVLWGCGGLWLILVVLFSSRIRLAIAINKVAAIFVSHTPLIVLVPAIQSIIGVLWCVLWALSASYLLSQVPEGYTPTGFYSSYAEAYGTADTPGACTNKWPTGGVWKDEVSCAAMNSTSCWRCKPPRYVFDARVCYSFFSFLWTNAFMIGFGQCLIAGAVGVWFFTPRAEKGTRPAIRTAASNLVKYHLGSIAFGALILAIVQFIRYVLMYFEKQAAAQKNRVMAIILRVLQCVIWCFEKCIKFLNKNAYIQVALLGKNFCTSAKNAFFLIMRNAVRFSTVAILGNVIHFIGYLFITSGTVLVGYFILRAMHPDVPPVVPLIIYAFMGYLVGSLFMNVFGLAVDTSLQCVIATEEMKTDGDFVPEQLRSVIQTSKE